MFAQCIVFCANVHMRTRTHTQAAMVLATEVLAQTVYRLNLNELPLDHLISTPHRHRASSMGRQGISTKSPTQPDFLLPHMPSFSNISSLRLPPHHTQWRSGVGVSGTPTPGDTSSSAPRSKGLGDSQMSLPPTNDHSTLQLSSPGVLAPIEEQMLERAKDNEKEREKGDLPVEASRDQEIIHTQPVVCDVKEMEEAMLDKHEACGGMYKATSMESQESFESTSIDSLPGQPLLCTKVQGESKKSLLSATTNLFKLRSPEAKHKKKTRLTPELTMTGTGGGGGGGRVNSSYSHLPVYEEEEELVEKARRRKKNGAHKRSGSDTTTLMVVRESISPSSLVRCAMHPQDKGYVQAGGFRRGSAVVNSPACTKKEGKKPFYLQKSSSDGNIHRLTVLPLAPPNDFDCHQDHLFGRMMTTGSPAMASESSSMQDIPFMESPLTGVARASTNTAVFRLQRSTSIESPEPAGDVN